MQTKDPPWRRISVSMSREQAEALRRLAAAEERSISYVVGLAVRMLLATKGASFLPTVHEKVMHVAEKNGKETA